MQANSEDSSDPLATLPDGKIRVREIRHGISQGVNKTRTDDVLAYRGLYMPWGRNWAQKNRRGPDRKSRGKFLVSAMHMPFPKCSFTLARRMRKQSYAIEDMILNYLPLADGSPAICPETPTSETTNLIAPSSRTHFSKMSCSVGAQVIHQ